MEITRIGEILLGRDLLGAQLKLAKEALQEWVDKQGHDRCWYYPDIFNRLCDILQVKPTKTPSLPPEQEFKGGCNRYRGEEYGSKPKELKAAYFQGNVSDVQNEVAEFSKGKEGEIVSVQDLSPEYSSHMCMNVVVWYWKES